MTRKTTPRRPAKKPAKKPATKPTTTKPAGDDEAVIGAVGKGNGKAPVSGPDAARRIGDSVDLTPPAVADEKAVEKMRSDRSGSAKRSSRAKEGEKKQPGKRGAKRSTSGISPGSDDDFGMGLGPAATAGSIEEALLLLNESARAVGSVWAADDDEAKPIAKIVSSLAAKYLPDLEAYGLELTGVMLVSTYVYKRLLLLRASRPESVSPEERPHDRGPDVPGDAGKAQSPGERPAATRPARSAADLANAEFGRK